MTDPIACSKCGAHWDFKTDYLGRLIAVHPITPCVSRPHGFPVECSVCEAPMRLEVDPGRRTLFWCSKACHERLMATQRAMRKEASRKYHQKQTWLNTFYHRESA